MVANFAGFNRIKRERVVVVKGSCRSHRRGRDSYVWVELPDGSRFETPAGRYGFSRVVEACRAVVRHTVGYTHYRRHGRIFRLSGESCDVD